MIAHRGSSRNAMKFSSIAATAIILLCGCTLDYRRDIAYNLLYKADGLENDAVFKATVLARFPPGTQSGVLENFAKANQGECQRKATILSCEMTTRAKFCQARVIHVKAVVNGDTIGSLEYVSYGGGC
jgi:hypothetical protein